MTFEFQVRRDDPGTRRFQPSPDPSTLRLDDGDVVLRVDSFAFTSNNITYGAMGDALRYWDFFPAPEGWGRIPVWGFGTVVRSAQPEVAEGTRYYGYFPMSSYVAMRPARVTRTTFVDGAAHRVPLHPLYNQYTLTPAADATTDALQLLYRPLFITSFILDDYFAEHAYFGASQTIVASASSKTAYGMAFLLTTRPERPRLVGLTSAANRAFVEGLRLYDRVVTYDRLSDLEPGTDSLYVDFSGNADVRRAVRALYGKHLLFSSAIGLTHWNETVPSGPPAGDAPEGAAPETFFAPTQIKKRIGDWGPAGFNERFDAAWLRFTDAVRARGPAWLEIARGSGTADVERVYADALHGKLEANRGHILTLV